MEKATKKKWGFVLFVIALTSFLLYLSGDTVFSSDNKKIESATDSVQKVDSVKQVDSLLVRDSVGKIKN